MVFKKAAVQVLLLLAGIAMLIFGIWREEAQTVFSKAIRLCMECVLYPAPNTAPWQGF